MIILVDLELLYMNSSSQRKCLPFVSMRRISQPPRPGRTELHHKIPNLVVEAAAGPQEDKAVDNPPEGDGAEDDEDICERDCEAICEDDKGHRARGEEDMEDRAAFEFYQDLF